MTPECPCVFIVLVNWNGLADTLECLASLARVDYPVAGVVVVDNGSRGGQAHAIRGAFPDVTVLETGRNLGFSGGNNVGIRRALAEGADYVLCLNNDTVVDPGFLAPLVEALESDPRAGIAASKIFFYDRPEAVWFLQGRCAFDERSIEAGGLGWHDFDAALSEATEPFETEYATGCAILVRAAIMRETAGFDERYFAYYEDVNLSLRAAELGWLRLVVPRSRVLHKVSSSSGGSESPSILYYSVRNVWLLAQAHAPHAADYYAQYAGRQKELADLEMGTSDAAAHGRAQARLSGIVCARLGLFGSRQDHRLIERAILLWVRASVFRKRQAHKARTLRSRLRLLSRLRQLSGHSN